MKGNEALIYAMYTDTNTHASTHPQTQKHRHRHRHIHTHTHTSMNTRTHTNTPECWRSRRAALWPQTQTLTQEHSHSHSHSHTYTHTHSHTHIHTYTHTWRATKPPSCAMASICSTPGMIGLYPYVLRLIHMCDLTHVYVSDSSMCDRTFILDFDNLFLQNSQHNRPVYIWGGYG